MEKANVMEYLHKKGTWRSASSHRKQSLIMPVLWVERAEVCGKTAYPKLHCFASESSQIS